VRRLRVQSALATDAGAYQCRAVGPRDVAHGHALVVLSGQLRGMCCIEPKLTVALNVKSSIENYGNLITDLKNYMSDTFKRINLDVAALVLN
jgi:hypothetical protein